MKRLSLLVWVLLITAAPLHAQAPVYNPRKVQFDSPDHALATQYVIEYWLPTVDPATGAPVTSGTIAQAQVTTTGQATPQYEALLSAVTPLPAVPTGTTYVARMKVRNAADQESVRSGASNPFAFLAAPRTPSAVSLR